VAAALAVGVRDRLAATWGIGLTGVAGPDPQDGKAVGTLFVGLAGPEGPPQVTSTVLTGDRAMIRSGAVDLAMTVLRDRLAHRE
jgi:nicotinamide-nucleotide amidase